MALVESDSGGSDNVELKGIGADSGAPPAWADALDETQYILSRLRVKIDSLVELHSKQLTRPTLDDTSQVRRTVIRVMIIALIDIKRIVFYRRGGESSIFE